jgi:hypothetical protein
MAMRDGGTQSVRRHIGLMMMTSILVFSSCVFNRMGTNDGFGELSPFMSIVSFSLTVIIVPFRWCVVCYFTIPTGIHWHEGGAHKERWEHRVGSVKGKGKAWFVP